MDTKSLLIGTATTLFQQKGYINVGLNEILKECNISKGSIYHYFIDWKEELLIACLQSLNEAITTDIKEIFEQSPTTLEAANVMLYKLIIRFETEGTTAGYTFSSILSEMALLSDSIRNVCTQLYEKIQGIYVQKLIADGFLKESAHSIALTMTASIEGGMMLCLTPKTSKPLKMISRELQRLI